MQLGKLVLIVAAAATFPTLALAQGKDSPPAILQSIEGCRTIADNAQRLACFDRVSAELSTAIEKKDVVVLDRKAVQETRRGLFGFALPKLRLFGGGRDDDDREEQDEVKELDTTIRSAQNIGYDKYRLVTAEGAIWVTEAVTGLKPKAGQSLKIKRGAIGSYTVSVNGRPGVKARREG